MEERTSGRNEKTQSEKKGTGRKVKREREGDSDVAGADPGRGEEEKTGRAA